MANSQFPLRIGARNGSNGGVIRSLKSNRIPHAWAPRFWWYQKFDILEAGALDGDTSQRFDLHTYNANNLFPANVIRTAPLLYLGEAFAGGTVNACVGILGDANDDNGLHTSTNIFTGATLGFLANTTAAAEFAPRFEAAFIPQLGINTTAGNISALTAGELWVAIGFRPVPGVS
jgi:hypothetical protein